MKSFGQTRTVAVAVAAAAAISPLHWSLRPAGEHVNNTAVTYRNAPTNTAAQIWPKLNLCVYFFLCGFFMYWRSLRQVDHRLSYVNCIKERLRFNMPSWIRPAYVSPLLLFCSFCLLDDYKMKYLHVNYCLHPFRGSWTRGVTTWHSMAKLRYSHVAF